MPFLEDSCTFIPLTPELLSTCSEFDCGHVDLNDFFKNDCVDYSSQLLGKSYCFTLDSDPSKIVCAFTISNDSVKTSDLPRGRKKAFIKQIPRVKHMRNYPAVLIGRLGVNEEFKRQKIGGELMEFIKAWFIDGNNKTGCRFIVVDSYNEEIPLSYYSKNGFEYMFLIEEQEKEYFGTKPTENLSTRLMYYDLILLAQ
jgi:GNAT superfamily N-acetyltransferase